MRPQEPSRLARIVLSPSLFPYSTVVLLRRGRHWRVPSEKQGSPLWCAGGVGAHEHCVRRGRRERQMQRDTNIRHKVAEIACSVRYGGPSSPLSSYSCLDFLLVGGV